MASFTSFIRRTSRRNVNTVQKTNQSQHRYLPYYINIKYRVNRGGGIKVWEICPSTKEPACPAYLRPVAPDDFIIFELLKHAAYGSLRNADALSQRGEKEGSFLVRFKHRYAIKNMAAKSRISIFVICYE